MRTKKLVIEGMMCPHCEAHMKKALEDAGMTAEVSHEKGCAIVTADSIPNDEELGKIVTEAGYTLKEVTEA